MIADYVFLFLVAAVAGAINSVAGGGTLLTFPALCVALGRARPDLTPAMAAVWANATSTVALCPGSLAGMWGYREELRQTRQWIVVLIWPSLIGGYIGSKLVMVLPAETFKVLVPWLILTAALLFLLQPYIARWTGIGKPHAAASRGTMVGIICFQFLVAIYGGYFGAGIGILMLSSLALIGLSDIHQMNGLKTLLALAINGVSVAVFAARWQGRLEFRPGHGHSGHSWRLWRRSRGAAAQSQRRTGRGGGDWLFAGHVLLLHHVFQACEYKRRG